MVESFNANFVETRDKQNREYTPFFNSLISKGIYIENYYGNSIQTCKGQESIFFSIIPSINGKLFVDYPKLRIEGFPAVLTRNGYTTLFMQAYHNLAFDNTEAYMHKAGFTSVESYKIKKYPADRKNIWGWGVEDGTFYKRAFEHIDELHSVNPNNPVFVSLATVGTHIPCDGMPQSKRMKYSDPKNLREKYENALALADQQLSIFFTELSNRSYLQNTIIIITADHSFPMREHGIYNNEICRYEESFRVPFLIMWNNAIRPARITENASSHLDIGPTLLDLTGLTNVKNAFIGKSIFIHTSQAVPLVQPYNGTFLEAVIWPYKIVKHETTNSTWVYNLRDDRFETKDIRNSIPDETFRSLTDAIESIRANQKIINENRVME